MDSAKIKNLEILAGITFKLEFELNRVKNWINSQLSDAELNGSKNDFQTVADENFGQVNLNSATLNNYDGNGQIFSSVLNQNDSSSSNSIIESQNLEPNETDGKIEIFEEDGNDEDYEILPHLIDDNDQLDNTITTKNFINSAESEDIDPLSTTNDNTEDDPVIVPSPKKKFKIFKITKFNTDILNRIRSERIITESEKSLSNKAKNVSKEKNYICTVCSKRLANYVSLKRHQLLHSTTKEFKCKFCPELYQTYNARNLHVGRVHRSELNFEFKCDCGLSFQKESAFENHKIEAHVGLECKYCTDNKVFYSNLNLFHHIQNTHWVCATPDCEMKFLSRNALKLHRRKSHPSNRGKSSKNQAKVNLGS